ncbi:MAG: hypothetical protein HYY93_15370 [Planctomycetes bacterium]|nr:hypothetical protein [Planctomycetota bacterium]
MRIDFNLQYHRLTRLVHGDDVVSFSELVRRSPKAGEHGAAEFFLLRADLAGQFGLTDRTELSLDIPYKRATVQVDIDDEHHRDETFEGPGDLRFAAKHLFVVAPSFQLAGTLGLSIPTGRLNKTTAASYLSHDRAAALGVTVPEHSHLQLGTGTFDPFVGTEALYRFDRHWMLYGRVEVDVPFYENRYGYRTSPSGVVQLGPAARIGETGFVASLFCEGLQSARDRFDGDDIVGPGGRFDGSFGIPNTGRFEVAFQPGLSWGITENLTLNLQIRVPVYTRIRENSAGRDVQLTEPVGAFLGMSWSF